MRVRAGDHHILIRIRGAELLLQHGNHSTLDAVERHADVCNPTNAETQPSAHVWHIKRLVYSVPALTKAKGFWP